MKYAIGYFDKDEWDRPFLSSLEEFAENIGEVYFPWPTISTCRTGKWNGYALDRLTEALGFARENGIALDLLMNANCYGGNAISKELERTVCEAVEDVYLRVGGPHTVTTTSLAIAHFIRTHFPEIKVRASVNMQLRSEECLLPVLDLFDEFYLPRELNYDFAAIERWKKILNGKPLYLLANSGCMAWCPGQIFHDNMVAHESEIAGRKNVEGFVPYVCWTWYKNHPETILRKGTWIRPEDIRYYKEDFSLIKLATRINSRPHRVIKAYVSRSFRGNTLNLLEPDHSTLLGKGLLDNTAFPEDFAEIKRTGAFDDKELFSKVFVSFPG